MPIGADLEAYLAAKLADKIRADDAAIDQKIVADFDNVSTDNPGRIILGQIKE